LNIVDSRLTNWRAGKIGCKLNTFINILPNKLKH